MKKFLGRFLVLCMILCTLTACDEEEYGEVEFEEGSDYQQTFTANQPTIEEPEDCTFTLMIYLCGADLESEDGCATADLNEILYSNFGEDVRVIVQTGGTTDWQNSVIKDNEVGRYRATPDGLTMLEELGHIPMLNVKTLSDFVKFGAQNYPADRYGLILWDHGGGTAVGYGVDETDPDNPGMSVTDIGKALKQAGVHLDFLGFDACLMATVEMAAAAAPYADYLLASEEMEPGTGWYYTNFMNQLGRNPGTSVVSLGKTLINDFTDDRHTDVTTGVTLSLVDLKKIDRVVDSLQSFMESATDVLKENGYSTLAKARSGCRSYGDDDFEQIDIVDFARRTDIGAAAELEQAIKSAIAYNGTNIKGSNGLAMYFPYYYPEDYGDTMKMLSGTQWVESSYETFYNDFISIMVNGQLASNGEIIGNGHSGSNDYLTGTDWEYITQYNWYNDEYDYDDYDYEYMDDDELILEDKGDYYALSLPEDQWDLVTTIWQQVYWDDGEGYFELGFDNLYYFDDDGDLIVDFDYTWIYLNDCLVPFYAEGEEEYTDGSWYSYGYVPALLNDEEWIELLIYWTSEEEDPYVIGYRYPSDQLSTMANKQYMQLREGDYLDFYFDYYTYDGEYQDGYALLNNTLYYDGGEIEVYYGSIDDDWNTMVCFYLQDIYQNEYWTEFIVYE